jgi:hypothetical protein
LPKRPGAKGGSAVRRPRFRRSASPSNWAGAGNTGTQTNG